MYIIPQSAMKTNERERESERERERGEGEGERKNISSRRGERDESSDLIFFFFPIAIGTIR